MEELDTFTEGAVKQPALRTCINANNTSNIGTPSLDSTASLRVLSPLASGDTSNVEARNHSHDRLSPDICQNGDAVDTNNYASTTVSSRSTSSSMSEQTLETENQQSLEVEQAISAAALLQHGTDEPFEINEHPFSESNEEGYDSEDEDEEINDSKLLEFMLQNSQSQEDFHNQYDQLTSSLQGDSSEKIQDEPQRLSEIDIPTVLDNINSSTSVTDQSTQNEKQCWVCFASEEDDTTAVWASPCRCRGTTKWVHQACIQRWVDEKQKGNNMATVECPQCGTKYVIHLPIGSYFVTLLDNCELLIQRVSPIIAGGVCVGSLYWTCVTFGSVTVMQALGQQKGLIFMEKRDPLFLLITLPLIPFGLVLGKMVRWQEPVLKSLRKYIPLVPFSRYILPTFNYAPQRQSLQASLPPISDPITVTRTFCGALFFPTIAAFLGATLYKNVPGQLKRTLLGGFTFVLVKGVLKIYHKQHNYIRQCKRQILDFKEDD